MYDKIIENFVLFSEEDDDIRAALIVGSRARKEKPADSWSDLDLVVFTQNPKPLLNEKEWLQKIGDPRITFLENTAVGGGTERRILFEGGQDVDFAVFPTTYIKHLEKDTQALGVLAKGVRVLIDKDKMTDSLIESAKNKDKENHSISQEELNNFINDFWYHAVLAAKKLRRGELLYGKNISDSYMKNILIFFIKTQKKLQMGDEFKHWHEMRFFEEWADSQVIQSFKRLYSRYEEDEIWETLRNTMQIYHEIAVDVCKMLNTPYPFEADRYANELVDSLYEER
ncbi:aminoglycoside 6-adenylyltransferase [Halalkalibacillus sediminis]|nr:aminoglycoside 6-adenylyltransferase [Halalkalibacillus sediminis]